jgi:predicted transcriptional regulator
MEGPNQMRKTRKNFRLNPSTVSMLAELQFAFGETETAVIEQLIISEYARQKADDAAIEARMRRQEAAAKDCEPIPF